MSYHHLTQNERYLIGHMHSFGRSIREIAKELARAPGTVSRELKRNQLPCVPHLIDTQQCYSDNPSD